jgi:catechol 2,3-dioxygenase-like lactoylglutathione lyase family enzyme
MTTPVISGDGIFSHVFIGAADVEKSSAFYDVVLGTLGINNLGPFGNGWVLYGREKPALSLPIRATVKHLPPTALLSASLLPPRKRLMLSTPPALPPVELMKVNLARAVTFRGLCSLPAGSAR